MKYLLFAILMIVTSCSLFKNFKTIPFHYSANDKRYTVPVQVPKGYSREKTTVDSAGNEVQFYYYANGSFIYVAHVTDSAMYQPIDTSRNIPLPHPSGGLIYKGLKSNGLFWREIRLNNGLIYGYKDVPQQNELEFDRALDFSSLEKVRE